MDAPTPTRPRIIFLGPPTVHLLRWIELAEEAGFVADLVTYHDEHPACSAHVPALRGGRLALLADLVRAARRLRRIVRETKPDLVHAHWLTGPGWIAALSRAQPLVVTAWGSDALRWTPMSRLARLLARLVARRAAAVTYDAESVADALARTGVPRTRLVRIVIGADAEAFQPREPDRDLLARLGVDLAQPVVLSARGLDPVYRQDVVVRALALLARSLPATLLLRVGPADRERLPALLALAAEHGVHDRVVPYENLPTAELPRLLSSVDVAVSVPESDGTSVLLLECLLCATPTVVSDLPANREWVADETGWIVPVGDPLALADALVLVLSDPGAAREAALEASVGARERGSRRRQRDELIVLYSRLLGPC